MRTMLIAAAVAAALSGGVAAAQDQALIDAATQEGSLLIYTTHGESFMRPQIDAFSAKYPGISVEFVELGGTDRFERYRAESSTGVRTADLILGGSPNQFVISAQKGEIMDFAPEGLAAHLGTFPQSIPGVIPLAIDVMSIIYNKATLPEELWPTGFADLADKVAANPDVFNGKVATWDPFESNLGIGFTVALDHDYGQVYWDSLAKMAPALKFEGGATAMMEKVTSGEYNAAYLVSRSRIKALSEAQQSLVGWTPFGGPEPANVIAAAIPVKSQNVNAAKLFVDFLVTPESQNLMADTGLYVINPASSLEDSYTSVVQASGGVSLYGYGTEFLTYEQDYLPRVNAAFGR